MSSSFNVLGRWFLGCAALALVAAPALAAPAKPHKVKNSDTLLYSFAGPTGDGSYPISGLIADNAGNFYGTTQNGGTNDAGTVFKLSSGGNESVLYSFAGGASDGAYPAASLIADSAGNLYGTTIDGGPGGCSDDGCGAVFEVTPSGTETVLYYFQGNSDGAGPQASLFMDGSGNIFGTTYAGGSSNCEGGCGTVFELTPSGSGTWNESVIYAFTGAPTDGVGPLGGLIEDGAGNLYGTTSAGGLSPHCPIGCGTAYELSPSGNGTWTERVIHAFRPPHVRGGDGAYPASNLMFDSNGNLYGTTPQGGSKVCGGGCGAIFELTPTQKGNWNEVLPYKFTAKAHGAFPSGGLVEDAAGNFYGVTAGAGTDDCGVVYQLNASGVTKSLYSFTGVPGDSCQPYGTLVMDQSGNLYGASLYGGASNLGGIFQFKK